MMGLKPKAKVHLHPLTGDLGARPSDDGKFFVIFQKILAFLTPFIEPFDRTKL